MTILYAVNSLCSGGAEAFAARLACEMARKPGTEVHLAVYAGIGDSRGAALAGELKAGGVTFHDFGLHRNPGKIFLPLRYAALIRRIRPDLVHTHLDQTDFFLRAARPLCPDIPFVRTLHSVRFIAALPRFVHRNMALSFDASVACSEFVRQRFAFPDLRPRLSVIPNGIRIEEPEPGSRQTVRKRLGIDDKETVLLMAGSLLPRLGGFPKAHDLVFRALHELPGLSCRLLFAGDASNLCRDYAPEHVRDSRFIFTGIVPDLLPFLSAADLMLAPSRFEGLPLTALEGACQGLPLVCSDIGAFDPFRGTGTRICRAGSVESLKSELACAVSHLPELKTEACKKREWYRQTFSLTATAERYLRLYERLLTLKKK